MDDESAAQLLVTRVNWKIRFGDNLYFAEDGAKAIELIREEVFDLVLLDLHTPIMNGFEVLDALEKMQEKEGFKVPPIFVLIGSRNPKDKVRAERHPSVKGYFRKPFTEKHANHLWDLSVQGPKTGLT